MRIIFKGKYSWVILVLGIAYLLIQLPFVLADPDILLATSRDANTDEGLNSCQVRNLVNHSQLTLHKSDNLVKTPLFGLTLLMAFSAFGTYLSVARLVLLLLGLIIMVSIFKRKKYYPGLGMVAFLLVMMQYHVFQYMHLALAEMLSTILILAGVILLAEGVRSEKKNLIFWSSVSVTAAWFLKIQFAYAVFILPFTLLLFFLLNKEKRSFVIGQLLRVCIYLGAGATIFLVFWYLPNKDFFNYVLSNQTDGRFVSFSQLGEHLSLLMGWIFHSKPLLVFSILSYISIAVGIFYLFLKPGKHFSFLFISLMVWLIFETHKLGMTYLPTRYLVSMFFAMGMIISLVTFETLRSKSLTLPYAIGKLLAAIMILILSIQNGKNYTDAFSRRTFAIHDINQYLASVDLGEGPVIGAWAPSLSWNSKALSYPVWKGYFNDKAIFEEIKPRLIVAEVDEEDSGQAFLSNGIDLDAHADSIRHFRVNHWDLKLVWVKQLGNNP